ncbi:MAG: stage V sporulation protein AE [Firmicutes bacterium HGW-Firmicutes-1]|jgi:stage V sporulation protein AE|nr:MAG: stage V sporulation protein AE [Firmicutes bacterium HGW-Firmicutes-1]
MEYIKAFITGGIICAIAQVLMDRTKLLPARIVVLYVVIGTILTGLGLYQSVVSFGGAGATVPIMGFGYALGEGVMKEVDKVGLLGVFTGGLKATSAGITAAILFGYLASIIFNSKPKK